MTDKLWLLYSTKLVDFSAIELSMPTDSTELEIKSILLLDDDIELADTSSFSSNRAIIVVTTVKNGVEGLHEVMAFDFDVIMCDMMMPTMPGDMFYLAVQRTKPHLCNRFIFVTGHSGNPKINEFLKKVNAVVLTKPVVTEELVRAISFVLKKSAKRSGQPVLVKFRASNPRDLFLPRVETVVFLQVLDHCAEEDWLWMQFPVFGDFRSVDHAETVALEHFRSTPAFEGHHLAVNTLFAVVVKVFEIGVHQGPRGGDIARLRQKIDVKMRGAARRGGDFAPAMAKDPVNKTAGCRVVTRVVRTPEQETQVLINVVQLLAQRLARAEQVALHLAVDLEHKRRLGLPIGVIAGQKIGKKLPILEHRVDRVAYETRLAAEPPHRRAVVRAVISDQKFFLVLFASRIRLISFYLQQQSGK